MGLRARILRATAADNGGPRKRNLLAALSRGRDDFTSTFNRMLHRGEIVMYGDRRGATYGPPGYRKPKRKHT